jgi:hypothetical protein
MYRAADSCGQTTDFLLSAKRDAGAAKRFFRKALGQPHTVNPRTITVDKNPAYPCATAEMKADGELWRFVQLRQCKLLNNIVEHDYRKRGLAALLPARLMYVLRVLGAEGFELSLWTTLLTTRGLAVSAGSRF